jgi:hypothetical protein
MHLVAAMPCASTDESAMTSGLLPVERHPEELDKISIIENNAIGEVL